MPELILVAVALAMDAFAVSVCKGLAIRKLKAGHAILIGLWFGVFQAVMPLIGSFLGSRFLKQIEAVDHWVAFGILAVIGVNMLREAIAGRKKQEEYSADLSFGTMFLLAVATSIDALAVGITFSLLEVPLLPAAVFIGAVTFGICIAGTGIGHVFGLRYRFGAQIAGGVILIAIGLKILIEHLAG